VFLVGGLSTKKAKISFADDGGRHAWQDNCFVSTILFTHNRDKNLHPAIKFNFYAYTCGIHNLIRIENDYQGTKT